MVNNHSFLIIKKDCNNQLQSYLWTAALPLVSIHSSISSLDNVDTSPYSVCFNIDVARPNFKAYVGFLKSLIRPWITPESKASPPPILS